MSARFHSAEFEVKYQDFEGRDAATIVIEEDGALEAVSIS